MDQHIVSKLAVLPPEFNEATLLPKSVTYLLGCRSWEQFCSTTRSLLDPIQFCPFCERERERRGRSPIVTLGGWSLVQNEFPHRNTSRMLLVVPLDHRTSLREIGPDWPIIGELITHAQSSFHIEGGGVMWRFGDPRYNVGTIEHLHINIVEPIPGKEYRPPFAKNEPELSEDYARLMSFCAQLFDAGGHDWLLSREGIESTQPSA